MRRANTSRIGIETRTTALHADPPVLNTDAAQIVRQLRGAESMLSHATAARCQCRNASLQLWSQTCSTGTRPAAGSGSGTSRERRLKPVR